LGKAPEGIYNAGFENISIIDMAHMITKRTGAEIVISESNDPRSYRQSSEKLLATGFMPNKGVSRAVEELVEAFHAGQLQDSDQWYTVKSRVAKGLA
jgi:hypothetical protein